GEPQPRARPAGRARARAGRRLVRVLPPLRGRPLRRGGRAVDVGHPRHRGRAAARDRGDGLRRGVPDADPPHRHHVPQGPEQHPARGPGRPGLAVRDRLGRRRARRDPPGAGHLRGLRRLRRPGPRARARGGDGPGAAVLPRPPLGHRAPGVVRHPRGRLDRLRGEPAEEVPGHLPRRLRHRPAGDLRRGPARGAALGEPRRDAVPGRQPAHQARGVLGVADRAGARGRPRRAVPLGGLHPARDDARPGAGGLRPELHVLHLAQRARGAARVPDRAHPRRARRGQRRRRRGRDRRLPAAELLAHDPRHPHPVHAVRRAQRLRPAGDHRRHRGAHLRHLQRLRAGRERGPARCGGAGRQREVPVQAPRLGGRRGRRHLAGAAADGAEHRPPRAPGPAAAARAGLPRQRRRAGAGVLAAGAGRALADGRGGRGAGGRQPRPAQHPRDGAAPGHGGAGARPVPAVLGARPARRAGAHLVGAHLRQAGPRPLRARGARDPDRARRRARPRRRL
ncbi:MAG: GH13_3 / GH13, partial [uncultured Quadrisphaera sp.]